MTPAEIAQIVVAVLGGGVLTQLFNYLRVSKKDAGDLTLRTLVVLNDRQDKVLSQLEKKCEFLEAELQGMRLQNVELHQELADLKAENKDLRRENAELRGRLQRLESEPKKHEPVIGL